MRAATPRLKTHTGLRRRVQTQHSVCARCTRPPLTSGVPPMPIITSTGASRLAVSIAPPTSPSLIMRMRAPAARISLTSCACRGRSSSSTVTSLRGEAQPGRARAAARGQQRR